MLDLGGVVCRFSSARRLDTLARASGLSAQEVDRRVFASGFDRDCDLGLYDLEQQCAQTCARLGGVWNAAELAELWAQAFEPDAGVLDVVDRVRASVNTALLTNNGPLVELLIQQQLPQVAARFDRLCFSYQVRAVKPQPQAYLATLERLGISPEQCIFVDDTEVNVDGARAVGIDAFRFVSAEALDRELRARGGLFGASAL